MSNFLYVQFERAKRSYLDMRKQRNPAGIAAAAQVLKKLGYLVDDFGDHVIFRYAGERE